MNAQTIIWSSAGIHTDGNVCVDVKANRDGVVLGQLHGEHDSYASDLHMSDADAERLGLALIEAAQQSRGARS